jgi:pimeloyl-ACP methyl ester carboxylesterase
MEKHTLTLKDGRDVELLTAGIKSKSAILFHHGTPGSTLTWQDWLPVVQELGGFAISYSRPGYGNSSRHEGRTVLDNSNDIKQILDHFGIEKVVSIGWSGGGPHALADTTLSQNVASISIAGVGEYTAKDLNFLEGMGEENHIEFGAAMQGKTEIETWMKEHSGEMATVTGEQLIEAFGGLIGEADKRSYTPKVADSGAEDFRHALSKGYYGWMDDDLAFVQHWGFDITKIEKPIELWQGDDDFMVPHAHGKWLADKIPTSKLIFVPGEGHISLGVNKRHDIIKNALEYLK